jgi:hypothetical protein
MYNLNQICINEIYLPVTPRVELPLNFRPEFGANLVFEFAPNSGLKIRANSTRGVTGSKVPNRFQHEIERRFLAV